MLQNAVDVEEDLIDYFGGEVEVKEVSGQNHQVGIELSRGIGTLLLLLKVSISSSALMIELQAKRVWKISV